MFFRKKSAPREERKLWTLTDICKYLQLDSIPDDTKITKEQFNGMRQNLDEYSIHTYSADRKIRVHMIKFSDGILLMKTYFAVDRVTISIRASYFDALNDSDKFLKEADKHERIAFSLN